MEKFIAVTMVLLILSMITEKIGNFVKMAQVSWIQKLMIAKDDKEREHKIQKMSMVIGIGVAVVSKANIFALYTGKEDFDFFWTSNDFKAGIWPLISTVTGSVLCGLFLSLGSKFFHDLLDMLLQVKNLKRKLVSGEEIKVETIEEYDKYLSDIEPRSMEQFLEKYFAAFSNITSHEL
ncbi:MAG: hypothetical protein JNJ99_11385, partial [Crocinitomicaceae bacterium]|nr:hypothetical protein [Crocinitomicaceae bacterium]